MFPRRRLPEKWLLILLAAVQFTHVVDFMILMPLGPQLMRQLSISAAEFSTLIAAYTLVSGVVGLLVAPFVDRFDRRVVLLTAYTGFLVGTWACAASETAGSLLIARGISGAFGGVSNATILAIVADIIPASRRGAAMGLVMTSFSAAAAFGVPFGLYLAQAFRWEAPFFFLLFVAIGVQVLLVLFLPPVREHLLAGPPDSWKNFLGLLSDGNAWRALLLMASLVFAHFTIIPFLSPHLVFNLKLSESHLAFVYILGGILTIISAPWIGRLSDRLGRVPVFTVLVCVAVVVILLLTHAGPLPVGGILLLTGLFFVFASGRYVPAQAVLASAVSAPRRGAFMSLSACSRDLCTGFAAVVAGRIVLATPQGLLHINWLGWLAMGFSILSIWLIRRVRAVP